MCMKEGMGIKKRYCRFQSSLIFLDEGLYFPTIRLDLCHHAIVLSVSRYVWRLENANFLGATTGRMRGWGLAIVPAKASEDNGCLTFDMGKSLLLDSEFDQLDGF